MSGKCKYVLLAAGALALSMLLQPEARAAGAVTAAPVNAAFFGPPAICFPIDIGDAESLPWGDDSGTRWSAKLPGYDVTRCVDDTLAILDASDDGLVHMETLRRFGVYVSGIGGDPPKTAEWRALETQRLLSNLQQRAETKLTTTTTSGREAAAAIDAATRTLGLRWFDVAYLKVVLSQAGLFRTELDLAALQTALQLRPDDGALHFGAAVASFDSRESRQLMWPNLDRALALSQDQDSLLSRNIVQVMGHFVGTTSREQLVEKVQRELEAS